MRAAPVWRSSLSKNLNTRAPRKAPFFRHADQINASTLLACETQSREKKEEGRDSPSSSDDSFRASARHPRRVLGRSFCVGRVTASRSFQGSAQVRRPHAQDLRSRRHSSCVSFEGDETRIPNPPSRNANSVP